MLKFYYIDNKYCITNTELELSERTIDIKFHDLANNKRLLNELKLVYLDNNYGATHDDNYRRKWFCNYLETFLHGSKPPADFRELLDNPTVRILIVDEDLLKDIKLILK